MATGWRLWPTFAGPTSCGECWAACRWRAAPARAACPLRWSALETGGGQACGFTSVSEQNSGANFDLPRRASRVDDAKCGSSEGRSRISQIGVVERVEELAAELRV